MKRRFFAPLAGLCLFVFMGGSAYGVGDYLTDFNAKYGTAATRLNTCSLCHPGATNSNNLNAYGLAFGGVPGHGQNPTAAFTTIEPDDSDGDGFNNLAEINDLKFPGDDTDTPVAADVTPPTVMAFIIPATSTSLTVPITAFQATDNVLVTGYLVTDSSAQPAPSAGFTASQPASFTFGTEGAKTLFAWARDAAGNVSSVVVSANVTITLPQADATAPTVTAFIIPATSSALTVPITSFTATDNVGVTGFLVTSVNVTPAPTDTRWSGAAPSSFVAGGAGPLTLFAWAKDGAGNVSDPLSASVTITLPPSGDTQAPTTPLGLSASATSGSVSLSWEASVDNVGVTGYLLFRNGVQITTVAATSFLDTTVTPAATFNYTVRAQDAAGNISASSNTVTVTTPVSGGDTMMVPTGVQVFDSLPTAAPIPDLNPAQALPIAFGAYAEGANAVGIQIGLPPFSGPVDVYLALLAPTLEQELLIFTEAGGLIPVSQGLVPWRANLQPGPFSVTVVPEISTSIVPPGRYTVFLAVTAVGSFDALYLWQSAFTVGVPIVTGLSGSQVVPPVTTTGTGVANLAVDPVSRAIAGTLSFSGLGSVATAARIHQGAAGTNGSTILDLEGGAGALSGVFRVPAGAVLTPDQLLALATNNLYLVVHTAGNTDGEIRGQIFNPLVTITKTLSGPEVVPPVDTPATATGNILVNVDTGEISGAITFTGLTANATGGHIHTGSIAAPGPIIVDFEGGDGLTSGTYSVPLGWVMTPAHLNALATNNTHFVIHSVNFGAGEISGHITYPSGAPLP